jgi:phenylpropionate dioxygenase-like ring-hydroxylating dioxygenase large terminal subunit
VFNQPDRFVAGWYWALRSHELKVGQVKPVVLLGRNLAIYRGENGQAIAVDAYCPHMGAHLAEGKVEGNAIRCFFHNWKFANDGMCIEVPSLDKPLPIGIKTWSTAEKYGLIWLWTGTRPQQPVPFVPELEQEECASHLGTKFIKNCHPNVVMINAIDAQHFNTVHNLPLKIVFESHELNRNAITFSNVTRGGEDSLLIKLIRSLYQNEVTYKMCYWYGSTGIVTLGPDFLHFHIMFALRLLENGKTEGQTVLITKQRSGYFGLLLNQAILWLTQQIGNYFAKGDTQIFQTIRFSLQTPIKADQSILQFVQHVEQQQILTWGTWEKIESVAEERIKDNSKPIEIINLAVEAS